MGRATVWAVGTVVLLVAGVAQPGGADWLQASHDAARTGIAGQRGPDWNDTAMRVRLPGVRAMFAPPIVVGHAAYVATSNYTVDRGGNSGDAEVDHMRASENRVWQIDMDTGVTLAFAVPSWPIYNMASDGTRLFVQHQKGMDAYDLATGRIAWSAPLLTGGGAGSPLPETVPYSSLVYCVGMAVLEGTLYAGCSQSDGVGVVGLPMGPLSAGRQTAELVALDVGTGRELWRWSPEPADVGSRDVFPPVLQVVLGLSVVPPLVFVNLQVVGTAGGGDYGDYVFTLDLATRTLQYPPRHTPPQDFHVVNNNLFEQDFNITSEPVGDTTRALAFVKLDDQLIAFAPATGEELWTYAIRNQDASQQGDSGVDPILRGDDLLVPTVNRVVRVDVATQAALATFALPPDLGAGSETWVRSNALAGAVYYGAATHRYSTGGSNFYGTGPRPELADRGIVYALDAADLHPLWKYEEASGFPTYFGYIDHDFSYLLAVSDGLLVLAALDGNVTVLGSTAASPKLVPDATSLYPAPGAPVAVDLAGSLPGSQGPSTAYRAEWGDGNATGWQASPAFTHTYAGFGRYDARFYARNEAGQTASRVLAFQVGAPDPAAPAARPPPPPESNLLESAFAPENQNVTFFVLGLLLTSLVALAGLLRVGRKRRRLARELRDLEEGYERTCTEPARCESLLSERQARFRSLFLRKRLEEAQVAFLERRTEDLRRSLRLREADDALDFLPHRFVKQLRGMLEDARVSDIERRHFVDAVQREPGLTRKQKETAKGVVQSWSARDRAARP